MNAEQDRINHEINQDKQLHREFERERESLSSGGGGGGQSGCLVAFLLLTLGTSLPIAGAIRLLLG